MKKTFNKIMIATAMMAGMGIDPRFVYDRVSDKKNDFDGDPKAKSKRHQDQGNAVKLSKKQKAKRRYENKAD